MKRTLIINPVLLLVFIFLINSCNTSSEEPATATEEGHGEETDVVSITEAQYKIAGIALGAVENKQISGTFKTSGVLDVPPQQRISISVPLGGFLEKTDLLQGQRVKKGQIIAVVENPDYIQMQQDYLEAKSQLEYAKADYERQQELAREQVNAGKTLQQARATFQTLTARVNALREKIKVSGISLTAVDKGDIQSSINIYSPITGYVTEVNANIGKFVNSADILFEIVDTEHLHAELTVFEKDIPRLHIGQKVRFTLANEQRERMAKVYLIGRKIDSDRTVRVHCHIDIEDIHLLPGMYLKAIVESGGTEVPALPDEAIVDFQGQKYVFISSMKDSVEHGHHAEESKNKIEGTVPEAAYHFKAIPVQTANSDGGYTEVILPADFNKTSKAVIHGAYDLLSMMKNTEEAGHGH